MENYKNYTYDNQVDYGNCKLCKIDVYTRV